MQQTKRRTFLKSSVLAGSAATVPWDLLPASDNSSGGKYIDAHAHIWSPDVSAYPLANGKKKSDLDPESFTDKQLMRIANPLGVNRVVLIQHQVYHGWDNSYLTDIAVAKPESFRVVGMVDDTKPEPAILMRKLEKKRVAGFRITSSIRGAEKWLTGPGMAAMWNCSAKTRQPMCCLINPEDLPGVDRMCDRFPETPVVIDHFARIGVDGKMRESDLKRLCRLARHKHTYVKVSAFYALGKKRPPYEDLVPMIRSVYESFGANRLMWASDSPYQVQGQNTYKASLDLIRKRVDFLSEKERGWMLWGTAEKVFFLGKA